MLSEMTPSELGEWLADYSISPWGEWRDDWRAAQATSILAEVNRNKSARSQPFTARDFMLDYLLEQQDEAKRSADLSRRLRFALLSNNKRTKQ